MKHIILSIILGLVAIINASAQNTMQTALDIGIKASSFSYSDTKNTIEYTNNYTGRSSNDVFYKFTLTRTMDVIISHCGSALNDTYLHLLSASGTSITFNDDYYGDGKCANSYHSRLSMINLAEGTYYIVSEGYSQNGSITTTIQGIRPAEVIAQNGGIDPSLDQNHILTITPTAATDDATSLTVDQSIQTLQYFDGLGRPSQTVQRSVTPEKKDLISFTEYDGVGRESRQWLPVPLADNQGAYLDHNYLTSISNSSYSDNKAYSETRYEPSPLNRITDQFGPGSSWHSNNKRITTAYGTNDGTIPYFFVNASNNLQRGNNYSPGTLYKTTIADEDGKPMTEFKDKLGRVVMVRKSNDVETYYVYNDLAQLSFVLPPSAVDALKHHSIGVSISDNHDALKKFGYIYKYDDRGNQTYKRLPGCEPVYIVYDKAKRLILSQDGCQRAKYDSQQRNKWTLYKYDVLGRMLYSSEINLNGNHQSLINYFKIYVVTETFTVGSQPYPMGDTGYSRGWYHAVPSTLLTVNYYDDYQFLDKLPAAVKTNLTYDNNKENEYGIMYSSSKGLLTGTRTYLLDGSGSYIATALYYDYKGQMIQTRSTNHLNGYDYVYNQFDFTGNVTKTLKEHNIAGQSTVTELYEYAYDHALRLKTTSYKLNNKPSIVLSSNTYDELGRLVEKKRHSNADTEEFEYNIRGWATKIKSGDFEQNLLYNTGLPQGATPYYNGNISLSTWTYEGLIKKYGYSYDDLNRLSSSVFYDINNQTSGSYTETFTYDKLGNITNLGRMGSTLPIDALTFTYFGNQIIKVDDLFNSQNQYSIKEYQNKVNIPVEFIYDANGNMITDLDREIVTIKYNLLNLPELIQFKNGCQIKNTYSADGQKLSLRYITVNAGVYQPLNPGQVIDNLDVNENDNVTVGGTDYIGNIEYQIYRYFDWDVTYEPAEWKYLYRVHNPEGYATSVTTTYGPVYYYYRKDHLGNNREVWRASYTSGSTTYAAATSQRTQYYASGLPWKTNSGDNPSSQPYKYGGKEFVEMHGFDSYDYGARVMYPAIMRFTAADPFSEKRPWLTPYHYCSNNPVNRVDTDGRWDVKVQIANGYGTAIVLDRNGNEIYRFNLRAEGVGGHNRMKQNSDTPYGTYDIPDNNAWVSGGSRTSYGLYPRLVMTPESGEIIESQRDLIRIHGGRQEVYDSTTGKWTPVDNPELKKTQGCIRAFDSDMKEFKDITDNLQESDKKEYPGKVFVSDVEETIKTEILED